MLGLGEVVEMGGKPKRLTDWGSAQTGRRDWAGGLTWYGPGCEAGAMVLAGIARVGQRSAWAEMLTPTRTSLGCGTGDLVGNGAGISGVLAGVREAALDEWGRSCEDRLELACSGRDAGADGLGLMGRCFREWQRCKAKGQRAGT